MYKGSIESIDKPTESLGLCRWDSGSRPSKKHHMEVLDEKNNYG